MHRERPDLQRSAPADVALWRTRRDPPTRVADVTSPRCRRECTSQKRMGDALARACSLHCSVVRFSYRRYDHSDPSLDRYPDFPDGKVFFRFPSNILGHFPGVISLPCLQSAKIEFCIARLLFSFSQRDFSSLLILRNFSLSLSLAPHWT